MFRLLSTVSFLTFAIATNAPAATAPPAAKKAPVTSEYHGVKVTEDYRWLEEADKPEVQQWTKAEDEYAREYLHKLPKVEQIRKQLTAWSNATSVSYWDFAYAGKRFYATKVQPPKEQPFIVNFASLSQTKNERIILDPNTVDKTGKTSFDFFVPSLDGSKVAVSVSIGGSESGTLHIYDSNGKELPDRVSRVQEPTGGGSVAWNSDGTGFYYTRYPRAGERPEQDLQFYQQVYFHKLGTPEAQDEYSIGKDFPRIAETKLSTSRDGKYVLASVANGDGGEFEHFVMALDGGAKWKQITKFADQIKHIEFGRHDDLYLLSRKNAPRGKILRLELAHPEIENAKEIVPTSEAVITEYIPAETRLYVAGMVGGPSQISVYELTGKPMGQARLENVSAVAEIAAADGDEVYYNAQSFLTPPAWYQMNAGKDPQLNARKTALAVKSPVSFADAEVSREFAVSKDGTKIPLNIVARKGTKRNGSNPTLLYGYGGYGISMQPWFQSSLRLWLNAGGVYVVANLRGGGEYGEEWHRNGNLTKKQNVFDDMIASAEYLIQQKVTSPKKLAAEGGSNGGLLMGAIMTERPDLFGAVVSQVGIYDMLRVELDPNGAFNVTEFGTVKDQAQFNALYAYSPYHHVKDGAKYPPTLLTTGANDGRVNPVHSKKMTARLQAVGAPVYLRVNFGAGHGMGTSRSDRISEQADVYAFLLSALDVNLPPGFPKGR
jgi:prolyl oligopeptidase